MTVSQYDEWAAVAERFGVDMEQVFKDAPDETAWRRALGHQTRLRVSAAEALDSVREAWRVTAFE